MGTLGAKATWPEIDELLASMPDQELAYLVVEATRLVKRRLAQGEGRGSGQKAPAEAGCLLMMPSIGLAAS